MEGQPAMIKVWDPFVRLFHWTLVPAVALALLTQDESLDLHVPAGYTVLGLVVSRVIWGLTGSRHARFRDFVFSPVVVIAYLKDLVHFRATRYLGHGPAGGAMVVALLASLLLTAMSGLALYGGQEYTGPLTAIMAGLDDRWAGVVEDVHEVFANLTLFLLDVHIVGVLFSSLVHRENLIWAMVTGYKRRAEREPTPTRLDGAAGRAAFDERMVI